jgi:hypothetical protein
MPNVVGTIQNTCSSLVIAIKVISYIQPSSTQIFHLYFTNALYSKAAYYAEDLKDAEFRCSVFTSSCVRHAVVTVFGKFRTAGM